MNPLRLLLFCVVFSALGSGCAYRMVSDVAIARSMNPAAAPEVPTGKEVMGDAYYPYLIGYNLDDAIADAFEKAGPEYDLLIHARIDVKFYYLLIYFSKYVMVHGTAVNSTELKTQMGEPAFDKWLASQNIVRRASP